MPSSPSSYPQRGAGPAGDRLLLGLAALLLAVQVGPWYYCNRDAPVYLSIARHLVHGEVQSMARPFLWYPPGYPLMISPLFLFDDMPLLEISVVHWLLAVATLWGTYRWARQLLPEGAVWIAALSVGTCSVWITHRQPVSETAFMALLAWLMVSLQAVVRPQSRGRFLTWVAVAVVLSSALCLTRLAGIAVVVGGACAVLAGAGRSRLFPRWPAADVLAWRPALGAALLIGAAGATSVGAVLLHQHWAAEPSGAATYWTALQTDRPNKPILDDYGPRVAWAVSDIGRITVPFMFKSYGQIGWWWGVNMLVYVPWFALLLYGYSRWICRSDDPLAWSLPFYFALLTSFRGDSGARWWIPITPALFTCLWFALEPWGRRGHFLRAFWLSHVVAGLVYWIGADLPRARSLDQKWPTVRSLAAQIADNRDRVIVDDKLTDMAPLFDLQLDRRVIEHSQATPLPDDAEWLIIPAEDPPPPRFVLRSSVAGCALFERR